MNTIGGSAATEYKEIVGWHIKPSTLGTELMISAMPILGVLPQWRKTFLPTWQVSDDKKVTSYELIIK